ncbi:signal peptide peptidase SppA [Nitratireductor pacificus]|uniref:Signal peptide peptidase SppA, 36K type n=1 Tax=Nitratireductor pacificus pht-3B TaxID=391937 RepID=K2MH73_9HYPH|nr:signal peptide peptidase SppA [Nitratireductor pacificus]EKF20065.1 signal peptide peptidase SppA, 36K type [Nitratireductor pacificus pht-3B]
MSIRADDLIDRRRLRRKLTFWRVVALAVIVLAIAFATQRLLGGSVDVSSDHIAQVKITGTILEDDALLERLDRIRKAPSVKGLIVTIDSPGGTTAGGEAIYEEIRRVAAEKPVVAQVGTLAASAGYMIASAADHIVARQSSIVGSIGVLFQFPDVTGLMDKLGIKLEEVKSSPMKAEPSPFNPTTEEERAMIRSMILDSYDWFVDLVAERRPLSREEVLKLADGAVYTGRQAATRKLVDELGGEREAKAWLVSKGVSDRLEIVEWKESQIGGGFFLPEMASRLFGSPLNAADILRELGADRMFLDGLLSVWQPENNN